MANCVNKWKVINKVIPVAFFVIPAKAGIQSLKAAFGCGSLLDSGIRQNDKVPY